MVDRHERQQIVGEHRKQHHAVDTANKERFAEQFIRAKDNGNVDEHIAQTHGDAEQAVQNGADARNAGDGDFGRDRKAVNARRRDKAAQRLQ